MPVVEVSPGAGSTGGLVRSLVTVGAVSALVLSLAGCGAEGGGGGDSGDSGEFSAPVASRDDDRVVDPDPGQELATRDFPTTPDGLTYGSDAEADTLSEAPDLVAVVATNGRAGFVAKEDLWSDHGVDTPEDARRYEQRIRSGWRPPPIEVRDLAGNPVGVFVLGSGSVEESSRGRGGGS